MMEPHPAVSGPLTSDLQMHKQAYVTHVVGAQEHLNILGPGETQWVEPDMAQLEGLRVLGKQVAIELYNCTVGWLALWEKAHVLW